MACKLSNFVKGLGQISCSVGYNRIFMLHGIELGPLRERPIGFNGGETKGGFRELSAGCSGVLKELSVVEIKGPNSSH